MKYRYAILASYIFILSGCVIIVIDSRHPLRFNVGFLIHQPIGISRDFHFEFGPIQLGPDLAFERLSGLARVGRTPQGLLVSAKFQGDINSECVRCLTEFDEPLETEFNELYAFNNRNLTESGLILPEDGNIDLEPLVRDYLLIEIPISLLCRQDCKGLCSYCGANLNEETCEHQRVTVE